MTRLKGRDDLGDVVGRLGRAFRSASLTALQTAFIQATAPTERLHALEALTRFHKAARHLHISESAFNRNAAKPGIMSHMRSPAQFAAIRDFSAAKEALLGMSPEIGSQIVRLVQGSKPADSTSTPSLPQAAIL